MQYGELVARLVDGLARPLPGAAAQALMAPSVRGSFPVPQHDPPYRAAAGLLLVFPRDGDSRVLLTVRSAHVRHSGQVSMPGGVIEPGESTIDAALREAHEEVAFSDVDVRVLGELSSVDIAVSGFRLHPVLATTERVPALRPSDREVARILEVPVASLLDPARVEHRPMMRGRLPLSAPAFIVEDAVIWGATAMVLAEFLSLVGWEGPELERS